MPTGAHSKHARSFSYVNADGLTPRSARSFQDVSLNEPRNDEIDFHPHPQSLPLLPANDGDKPKPFSVLRAPSLAFAEILKRVPLVLGILVALLLFILVVIAYEQPRALLEAAGQTAPASLVGGDQQSLGELSQHINYSDYTTFPLQPIQYASECWKVIKAHSKHYGYWTTPPMGILDVPHADDSNTTHPRCASTITYQLDGYVGLTAHLAFIAQLAAMATEVSGSL